VDYVVLNASCPNVETPENIYKCLQMIDHTETPVLVKLHIMEDKVKLNTTLSILHESSISGVICSNTFPMDKGGLSGKPLTHIGHQQLEWVKENSHLPVISSGGVMTPQDAVDRIRLGADLVQVYTGFVYGGITFPYRVAKAMRDL
jgi:dihydroorotate dehydrogenase